MKYVRQQQNTIKYYKKYLKDKKIKHIKEILNNITNKLKKENQELLSKSTNEKEINIPYKFYRL